MNTGRELNVILNALLAVNMRYIAVIDYHREEATKMQVQTNPVPDANLIQRIVRPRVTRSLQHRMVTSAK